MTTWDPPPGRPGRAAAGLGLFLSATTIAALVAAGWWVRAVEAEDRYVEAADSCAGLDAGPLAASLGLSPLRPEQGLAGGSCSYLLESADGSVGGGGQVRLSYFPDGLKAWLAWLAEDTEGEVREVPGLGRAARLRTERVNSGIEETCSVQVRVLDENLIFAGRITALAELPSRPCENMAAIGDALIENARAALGRLG